MASDPVYALAGRNGLGRMANVQTSQPLVTCSVSPPRRGFFVGCEEYDESANDPSTDSIIAARTREMLCVRSDTARSGFLCRSSREIGRAHVELQSLRHLVCRLLLEKKKQKSCQPHTHRKLRNTIPQQHSIIPAP